jgi:superfamily II DNA or RNA helicase
MYRLSDSTNNNLPTFSEKLESRGYSSMEEDISQTIVANILRSARWFKRSVGFLKLNHLREASDSLAQFALNGGKAEFLIGCPLLPGDFEAVVHSTELLETKVRELESGIRNMAASGGATSDTYYLMLIQYMIAQGQLDIRLVLKPKGMHHEKIRIAEDSQGDMICTVGSDNDTESALLESGNQEAGNLFVRSDMTEGLWAKMVGSHISRFKKIWEGNARGSKTFTLSEQIRLEIKRDWEARELTDDDFKTFLKKIVFSRGRNSLPSLRDHQKTAAQLWQKKAKYRGILAHCTGSGKTVTSLYCATKLADYYVGQRSRDFFVLVAVPFRILAEQWLRQIEDLGYDTLKCWDSRNDWEPRLQTLVQESLLGEQGRVARAVFIVCVNNTLVSEAFQAYTKHLPRDRTMVIGDEVHRHGNPRYLEAVPQTDFMLGLSATPWSAAELERKNILTQIYGDVIDEFGLERAMAEDILCQYIYKVIPVTLNDEEEARYEEISNKIAQLVKDDFELLSNVDKERVRALLRNRNAVIGSCNAKFEWLERESSGLIDSHTLFYCGDGKSEQGKYDAPLRDIQRAGLVLSKTGWIPSRVTAEESPEERTSIIESFSSGDLQCICAIRVLDEGFDLPACKNAFLMASSKNERQFIQRRGRVLRKVADSPDKVAVIYDFLVTPSMSATSQLWAKSLVADELIRIYEFARFALTKTDVIDAVLPYAEKFNVAFEDVTEMVESRSYMSGLDVDSEDISGTEILEGD